LTTLLGMPITGSLSALARPVAAAAVTGEALVLLVAGGYLAVETVTSRPAQPLASAVLAAMTLLCGAALGAVALGVHGGRRWARGPAITWQILQGAVAVSTLTGRWYLAGPLLVACAVVLVALLGEAAAGRG
jgi:hypothetical protein